MTMIICGISTLVYDNNVLWHHNWIGHHNGIMAPQLTLILQWWLWYQNWLWCQNGFYNNTIHYDIIEVVLCHQNGGLLQNDFHIKIFIIIQWCLMISILMISRWFLGFWHHNILWWHNRAWYYFYGSAIDKHGTMVYDMIMLFYYITIDYGYTDYHGLWQPHWLWWQCLVIVAQFIIAKIWNQHRCPSTKDYK